MLEEYQKVIIKPKGIIGTIVDKTEKNGAMRYVVESDVKGRVDGLDGGEWPLYDCEEEDLIPVKESPKA